MSVIADAVFGSDEGATTSPPSPRHPVPGVHRHLVGTRRTDAHRAHRGPQPRRVRRHRRRRTGTNALRPPGPPWRRVVAEQPEIGQPAGAEGNAPLEARSSTGFGDPSVDAGLTSGNRTVSRIPRPVSAISRQSMPMPVPDVGGMPCSIAANSSSSTIASSSPAAARRA